VGASKLGGFAMLPQNFKLNVQSSSPSVAIAPPKDWVDLVKDLRTTRPWPGLLKVFTLLLILATLCWVAFGTQSVWVFLVSSTVFAVFYASLLITTHDASHGTLTGLELFDEIFPRFASILAFWPHGIYKEVHKLHHKMNGTQLDDPERVHWTHEEYVSSGILGRLYAKNQVFVRTFVFGGFGLLLEMLRDSFKYSKRSVNFKRALVLDICYLTIGFGSMLVAAAHFGVLLKFIAFYFIIERVTGGVLQTRNSLEHYGLWGKRANYFETQLFSCRNIRTNPLMSWYFNGLNFHSVHHAFPDIPFYKLCAAHSRFQNALTKKGHPLVEEDGYFRTFGQILSSPCLISTPSEAVGKPLPPPRTHLSANRLSQNARVWILAVQKKLSSFPFAG
jgi:fatty acid desaturase